MCNIIFCKPKNPKNATVLRYLHKTVALFLPKSVYRLTLFFGRNSDLMKLLISNYGNGGCDGFSPNFPLNASKSNTEKQKY